MFQGKLIAIRESADKAKLDGSIKTDAELLVDENANIPKNFLTIWSTTSSTKTVTAWVTDTGVTVSISAMCTIAAAPFQNCG